MHQAGTIKKSSRRMHANTHKPRSRIMNRNILEGNWKQLKGNVQKQWGKLTDDDLDVIEGQRTMLAGKIQERYGVTLDEAEEQLKSWEESQRQ
jgi:uncharacterized protein YjbJ (UPF0337 family)